MLVCRQQASEEALARCGPAVEVEDLKKQIPGKTTKQVRARK
jgi:hypothetical protein